MEPLRVLHLRSSGGMLGAERVIIEICKHSAAHNVESHVGVLHNSNDPIPVFYETVVKESIPSLLVADNKAFSVKLVNIVRDYCRTNRIALIHAHGYKEDIVAFFCTKIPKIATNHLWKLPDFKARVYSWLDLFTLHFFRQVIGVSDEIVNELRSKGLKKAYKINNGIDLSLFRGNPNGGRDLKRSFSLTDEHVVVGMISSLTHEKNHSIALQAFKRVIVGHRSARLLIVGDGPLRGKLESMAMQMGLGEQVVFTGTRSDIPQLLSMFDVFLLTSTNEGLPMAMLEAMAAGKPVIASSVGDIPNVLADKFGIQVRHDDAEEIAGALGRLISDSSLREHYSRAARERATDYSSERMTEQYCGLYRKILEPENVCS